MVQEKDSDRHEGCDIHSCVIVESRRSHAEKIARAVARCELGVKDDCPEDYRLGANTMAEDILDILCPERRPKLPCDYRVPESTREILAEMQRVCREISEHREQLVYTALVHDNCPECGQRPRKVVWVIPLIPRADKLLVERLLCTCDRGHSWYAGKIESAIKTDSLETES